MSHNVVNNLLFIFIGLIFISCEKFADKEFNLTVLNSSSMPICVSVTVNVDDTLDHSTNYSKIISSNRQEYVRVSLTDLNKDENIIKVFVYNKDSVDKYGFNAIKNVTVLKRYQVKYYTKRKDRKKNASPPIVYP